MRIPSCVLCWGYKQRLQGRKLVPRAPLLRCLPTGLSPALSPQVTSMCLGPSWWTWSRAPWTPSGLDPSARSSGQTTSCLVCRGDVWALAQWAPFLLIPWGSLLGAWGKLCVHRGPESQPHCPWSMGCQLSGPCPHSSKARVSLQRLPQPSHCRAAPGQRGQRTKSEGKLPAAVHRPPVISEDP